MIACLRSTRLLLVGILLTIAGHVSAADATSQLPTLATAPTGVYGLRKLVPTYSGPALKVTRASDGTQQDIGFSGLDLDVAAAQSFGDKTKLRVVTLYDQSGHGNNLTQDVAKEQPILSLDYGAPVLLIRGGSLKIPATLTADRAHVSIFTVNREVSSYTSSGLFYFGPQEAPVELGLQGFINSFGSQPLIEGKLQNLNPDDGATVGTATPAILGLVSAPGGITIHRDNKTATSDAAPAKLLTSGGELGRTAKAKGRLDLFAWIFYPAALSDADVMTLKTSLQKIFHTNTWTPKLNIALQGDSKTYGVDTPNHLTLARLLADQFPDAIVRNMGIGGRVIKGDKTRYSKPRFTEPGAQNIMVLYEGTNDLGGTSVKGGDSAENIWGYYKIFVENARANGWNRIVACTITPRPIGGFTADMEKQRMLLNQWIRENKDHLFDAVADFAGIPEFGPAEHPVTTYLPDGLHENEAAYMIEVPVLAKAIKAALASPDEPAK